MPDHYTWILTADPDDEEADLDFIKDELVDFLERNSIEPTFCSDELNEKSQYTLTFYLEKPQFKLLFNDLIGFEMAGFRTTSVHVKVGEKWTKLWKKGRFYDVSY